MPVSPTYVSRVIQYTFPPNMANESMVLPPDLRSSTGLSATVRSSPPWRSTTSIRISVGMTPLASRGACTTPTTTQRSSIATVPVRFWSGSGTA